MAVLTDEQRARKRQRDAEYRARKNKQREADVEEFNVSFSPEAEQAVQDLLNGKISKEDFAQVVTPDAITFSPVVVSNEEIVITEDPSFRVWAKNRADTLGMQLGDTVVAPVTQLNAVICKTFRAGGRLLTEDGEHMWANQCPHSTDERAAKGTVVFFEMVGDGNRDFADGTTGLVHRFSRCNKIVTQ